MVVVVLLLVVNLDPIIIAKPLWLRIGTACLGLSNEGVVGSLIWSFSATAEAPETENLPYKGRGFGVSVRVPGETFDGFGLVSVVSLGHDLGNHVYLASAPISFFPVSWLMYLLVMARTLSGFSASTKPRSSRHFFKC